MDQLDRSDLVLVGEATHGELVSKVIQRQVFPSLMPFACYSHEHLAIMRSFWKCRVHCRFVGVDIQALDFPDFGPMSSEMKALSEPFRKEWDNVKNTLERGTARNRINADIISQLVRKHPNCKHVYFAQNEHVSKNGSSNTRSDPTYLSEGFLLSQKHSVLSLGTWAHAMWHTWQRYKQRSVSMRMIGNRRSDFDYVYVRSKEDDSNETLTLLK